MNNTCRSPANPTTDNQCSPSSNAELCGCHTRHAVTEPVTLPAECALFKLLAIRHRLVLFH